MTLDGVRALVFDTFGTVVDWYSGLAREAGPFLVRHGKRTSIRATSPMRGASSSSRPWRKCAAGGGRSSD